MKHLSQGEKRTLLIVGSGFIAAQLARTALSEWGWSVEVLYRNYRNPDLGSIPSTVLPTSVGELMCLLNTVRPTDVVIAAGSSFVPEINKSVELALNQHMNVTLMILDALSRLKQPLRGRVLVIGSASEYGEFPDSPVDELRPALPRDHYGLIKLSLRQLGLYFYQEHDLPVIHLRQFNVTGPEQDKRFVIPSICHQIANGVATTVDPKAVAVLAGNISVRRDFLAVSDVCQAYRTLMLDGKPGEIYNVCSGEAYRISELIEMAAEAAGVEVQVEVSSQLVRESDKAQEVIWGDPSKICALGWAPRTPIRDLLSQMIRKYTPISGAGS